MRTLALALLAVTLVVTPSTAQQEAEIDIGQIVADFGRRATGGGLDILVVHLNDKTTDALFDAPAKYSLRAQARGATMFYVLGTAEEDATVSVEFRVLEESTSHRPTAVNISNFENGVKLSEGEQFQGILALEQLIPPRNKMTVTNGEMRWVFEFTPNVLAQLAN